MLLRFFKPARIAQFEWCTKKYSVETLLVLVSKGVEALNHKVKQRPRIRGRSL